MTFLFTPSCPYRRENVYGKNYLFERPLWPICPAKPFLFPCTYPSRRMAPPTNPIQILDNIPPIGTTVKEIPAKPHNGIQPNLTFRK